MYCTLFYYPSLFNCNLLQQKITFPQLSQEMLAEQGIPFQEAVKEEFDILEEN